MLRGILVGSGWFFVFVLTHVLWFHFKYVERRALLILAVFLFCALAAAGTLVAIAPDASLLPVGLSIFYAWFLMACLFVLYMPFYFTIATSLSVQTLIFIEECGGTVTLSDLQKRFASAAIVSGRLDTMIASGYLQKGPSGWSAAPKGRSVARVFKFLKEVWRLGPGG